MLILQGEKDFQVSDTNDAPLRWLTLELRSGCCFTVTARDTTDGQGRASVTVIHGPVAGPGLVLVTPTGFGETDTARITTTHGAAVGSRVLPADRPIALGSSYQLSALLVVTRQLEGSIHQAFQLRLIPHKLSRRHAIALTQKVFPANVLASAAP